jgi:hypothetical protein
MSPQGEAPARRSPLRPAAAAVFQQADASTKESTSTAITTALQQKQPSLTKPVPPPRRAPARRSPLQKAAATNVNQADASTKESTSTTITTADSSSNHR